MANKDLTRADRRRSKKSRIRKKVFGTASRPRLAVFRSARNIYAQLIDDSNCATLGGMSTLSPEVKSSLPKDVTGKIAGAEAVGKAIAETAKKIKVESVVFDRGGFLYHGRVKALADGARKGGLIF